MYKYQQWKFIINLLYLSKSYSEVKWDCNVFISLLFEIFLNFIFLMCPQIVSNWNLNSFLVGKVWRSERRRWDGLSPHWSHKSRQQGTFWSSCQFMHEWIVESSEILVSGIYFSWFSWELLSPHLNIVSKEWTYSGSVHYSNKQIHKIMYPLTWQNFLILCTWSTKNLLIIISLINM